MAKIDFEKAPASASAPLFFLGLLMKASGYFYLCDIRGTQFNQFLFCFVFVLLNPCLGSMPYELANSKRCCQQLGTLYEKVQAIQNRNQLENLHSN